MLPKKEPSARSMYRVLMVCMSSLTHEGMTIPNFTESELMLPRKSYDNPTHFNCLISFQIIPFSELFINTSSGTYCELCVK